MARIRNPLRARSPRRRRNDERPSTTLVGGLLVCLLLIGAGYLALSLYNGVPGRDYRTAYVSVPEVGNLLNHDPVRINGVRVGQVVARDVGRDGRPRVELQLEPGTELTSDAKVRVRANGLLGGRYIELVDGDSTRPLPDGATISGGTAAYTYGLPETLQTFDRQTRGALGTMLGGLGQGFLGNGIAVNDALHKAAVRAEPFSEIARAILRRDGSARRLLPALERAARPLAANREGLAQLPGAAAGAVGPLVTERDSVRRTLADAPSTLRALAPGLEGGTRLVGAIDRLAVEAQRTLAPAAAGLRRTAAFLRESHVPLDRTTALLEAARPAIPGVLGITSAALPVLEPLSGLVDALRPTLQQTAPFGCDIVNFGVVMRSMTGYTQPGPDGPVGPPQAFRLQVIAPLSTDVIGVKDATGLLKREGLTPCKYLAKPYPQFVGGDAP